MTELEPRYYVAVIGAGPAGLFAARELAGRGVYTVLLNRDIKPGGLAEYGIYPTKSKMKEGLRNQFRGILAMPDVAYYGNVLIGEHAELTLANLRDLGFQAILVTVGAQSTKHLGIPGEDLPGVYHAKELVYHYNLLPPFSETAYPIGKRVAVVGVGNVMMDITRWLLEMKDVDEVIAVARRGPAEVKFDHKELETLIGYLDNSAVENELSRVTTLMRSLNQDPETFRTMLRDAAKRACPVIGHGRFSMRFLASPARVLGDTSGGISGFEVEENTLILGDDGEVRAKGTHAFDVLDVDTVIFAIGDVVDSAIGLPIQYGEYVKNPQPRFPVDGTSYEAFDPQTSQVIPDIFLAGWARRPSAGLVGVARKDATSAAQAVGAYLQTIPPATAPVAARVAEGLMRLNHPVVDKSALLRLEAVERERAQALHLESFKFGANAEMLEALGLVSSREK